MAGNVYAQMEAQDAAPTASAPPPVSNNVYAQMDTANNQQSSGATWGNIAKNVGAGFEEGITSIPGMFTDPASRLVDAIAPFLPENSAPAGSTAYALGAGRKNTNPVPVGSTAHALNKGLGAIGLNPENVAANTSSERIARGIGAGATALLFPEEGGLTVGKLLANGTIGAASGAGSAGAAELVPNEYKPIANILGGLVTGIPTAAGISAIPKISNVIKSATTPMRIALGKAIPDTADASAVVNANPAASDMAANVLHSRASDPASVQASLENGANEIVPGSKPTTFQQTGDMGLGALEREVAAKNPAEFAQRRAEQNTARISSLNDIQQGADPNAVSGFLNSQFRDLDVQTSAHLADLMGNAQFATSAIGGTDTPEAYGAATRAAIQTAMDATKTRERGLWDAVDPHGDLTGNMVETATGARDIVKEVPPTAKPMAAEEAAIFEAAKNLPPIAPVRDLIALRSRVSSEIAQQTGPQGDAQALRRLTQLRGAIQNNLSNSISQQIANEARDVSRATLSPDETTAARVKAWIDEYNARKNGNVSVEQPGASSDLQQMQGTGVSDRGAILPVMSRTENSGIPAEDTIDTGTAIERRSAQLRGGLQTPRQVSEDGLQNVRQSPQSDASSGLSEAAPGGMALPEMPSEAPPNAGSVDAGRGKEGARQHSGNGPPAIAGINGTGFSPKGGSISSTGNTRIPEGTPTFDEAGAGRLAEATAATKQRARTYGVPPVAAAIQKSGASDIYRYPEATVPGRFFNNKPTGYSDMQSLYRAVGQDQATPLIQDYAAWSLRKAAFNENDGILNPNKFATWRRAHAESLRALPQDVQDQFSNAANASQAVSDATRLREQALKVAQEGAIGRITNAKTPEETTAIIGSILNGKTAVSDMRELAQKVQKDDFAKQGFRQAVADHIAQKYISNTEAGTSGESLIKADEFQTFVRQKRPALEAVFTPAEIRNMQSIADDIQRAKRSENAVKLPGGSNTTQDIHGIAKNSLQTSPAARRFIDVVGSGIGSFFGPVGALMGGFGTDIVQGLRESGINRVDQLVTKAMLHPEIYRALQQRVPLKPNTGSALTLAKALRRSVAATSMATMVGQNKQNQEQSVQGYKDGGIVEASTNKKIDKAASAAANDPTPLQKQNGNFSKGHIRLHGLDITIETPRGKVRSGTGHDGKAWENKNLLAHYGYIKGSSGADSEHVDSYIGPSSLSQKIFVVDQQNPKDGSFDEHKVILGAKDLSQAHDVYDGGFSDKSGPWRRGAVTEMNIPDFKKWLKSGDTTKPVGTLTPRTAQ